MMLSFACRLIVVVLSFFSAPAWMKDNWYWIVVIVLVLVVVSILGYALCCYRRGASSADDELVTMDLKT